MQVAKRKVSASGNSASQQEGKNLLNRMPRGTLVIQVKVLRRTRKLGSNRNQYTLLLLLLLLLLSLLFKVFLFVHFVIHGPVHRFPANDNTIPLVEAICAEKCPHDVTTSGSPKDWTNRLVGCTPCKSFPCRRKWHRDLLHEQSFQHLTVPEKCTEYNEISCRHEKVTHWSV